MKTFLQSKLAWLVVMTLALALFCWRADVAPEQVVQTLTTLGGGVAALLALYSQSMARNLGTTTQPSLLRFQARFLGELPTPWVFVNGILASWSDSEWDLVWAKWVSKSNLGISRAVYYWTGLLGLWGRSAAIQRCADALRASGDNAVVATHSFGAYVFLQAMLANPDLVAAQAHIMAGACKSDCNASGLNAVADRIGKVYLYTSTGDSVLKYLAPVNSWLGFGQLGYTGPVNPSPALQAKLVVTPHNDYGHEDYVYLHAADMQREILSRVQPTASAAPSAAA